MSPDISLHLPISPYISRYLPTSPQARYSTCDAEQQYSDDEIDRRLGLAPSSAAPPAAAPAEKRQVGLGFGFGLGFGLGCRLGLSLGIAYPHPHPNLSPAQGRRGAVPLSYEEKVAVRAVTLGVRLGLGLGSVCYPMSYVPYVLCRSRTMCVGAYILYYVCPILCV